MSLKDERGQALFTAVAAIVVLMGFAGLGIDMGMLRYEKRLQQSAADAAAIAGASDIPFGGVTAAAQSTATTNGFAYTSSALSDCTSAGAAVGTICVQVNNPPASGPHSGNSNYVEVYVAEVQPTYFMPILGVTKSVVTARSVAGMLGGPETAARLHGTPVRTPSRESISTATRQYTLPTAES
jgi:uncharacterized membrane protein